MQLSDQSDEELMVLYQNGAESAFQLLYARHAAKILGYVQAKIKNTEKAHDIFQEIFVKIHRSKHLYNKNLPVLPWIFTITKNTLIDSVRKNKNESMQTEFADTLHSLPEDTSRGLELGGILHGLPPPQKQALELRFFEEKTFAEIALVLNTSPLNVRQLVSRGLKRLRNFVNEGGKK